MVSSVDDEDEDVDEVCLLVLRRCLRASGEEEEEVDELL